MLPNPASGGGPYTLSAGAAGEYTSYYTTLATNLSTAGWNANNCIIRLGWEFNGSWAPWFATTGQEANFTAYWQNIVNTMSAIIPDLKFIWDPNVGNNWGSSALENYYPGSSYVNYIGMDVYDTVSAGGSAAWPVYLNEDGYGLNWLAKFAAARVSPLVFRSLGLDRILVTLEAVTIRTSLLDRPVGCQPTHHEASLRCGTPRQIQRGRMPFHQARRLRTRTLRFLPRSETCDAFAPKSLTTEMAEVGFLVRSVEQCRPAPGVCTAIRSRRTCAGGLAVSHGATGHVGARELVGVSWGSCGSECPLTDEPQPI